MGKLYRLLLLITCATNTIHSIGLAANATPKTSQPETKEAKPQTELYIELDQIKLVIEPPPQTKPAQQQEQKTAAIEPPMIWTINGITASCNFLTTELLAQPLCRSTCPTTDVTYSYKFLPIKSWFDAEIYRRLALITVSRYITIGTIHETTTDKVVSRNIVYFPDNDEKSFVKEFPHACKKVMEQLKNNWTECPSDEPLWRLWQMDKGDVNMSLLINALLAKFGLHEQAFSLWNWDPDAMSGTLYLAIKKSHITAFNKKFLTHFYANGA